MCSFGSEWQKYTTLMYSAGFDAWLDPLGNRECAHSTHSKIAGGEKVKNKWNSNDAAAYPPDFNSFLAQAVAGFVRQRQADHGTPAARTTVPLRDPTRAETFRLRVSR